MLKHKGKIDATSFQKATDGFNDRLLDSSENIAVLNAHPTLVLNADYAVLQKIGWRDAMEMSVSGKATVLENHKDVFVHTGTQPMPLPSVIVSSHYHNIYRTAAFTRKNVFLAYYDRDYGEHENGLVAKDGGKTDGKKVGKHHQETHVHNKHWICGLCGGRMALSEVTFDHIIPRSRGGKTTWDNIVLAHPHCNSAKGHKTLAEAGMKLHVKVRKFTDMDIAKKNIERYLENESVIPETWMDFIGDAYYNSVLQK